MKVLKTCCSAVLVYKYSRGFRGLNSSSVTLRIATAVKGTSCYSAAISQAVTDAFYYSTGIRFGGSITSLHCHRALKLAAGCALETQSLVNVHITESFTGRMLRVPQRSGGAHLRDGPTRRPVRPQQSSSPSALELPSTGTMPAPRGRIAASNL